MKNNHGRVLRHAAPVSQPVATMKSNEDIANDLADHLSNTIGTPDRICRDDPAADIKIDVIVIEPSSDRNFFTYVTAGLSAMPMNVPADIQDLDLEYAELMICLPEDWPLSPEELQDMRNRWPLQQLLDTAKAVRRYNSWICHYHTVASADPPVPFADDTGLSALLLSNPFSRFELHTGLAFLDDDVELNLYSLIPLYKEELDYKLEKGGDALIKRLKAANVDEVIDRNRVNVCAKPPSSPSKKR